MSATKNPKGLIIVKFTIPSRKIPCEAFFDIAVPDDPRNWIEDESNDKRFGGRSQYRSDGSNFDTILPLTELFAIKDDLALVGLINPGKNFYKCRFASAVFPDESSHLSSMGFVAASPL